VIIDLSSNDRRLDVFERKMSRMVTASLEAGVRPLLVLEPNSMQSNRGPIEQRHRLLREIAAATGVPCFDAEAFLDQRYDSGFLWWDHVHLTSWGQHLMAQGVYQALVKAGIVPPAPDEDSGRDAS
jgi:hypothetical protein